MAVNKYDLYERSVQSPDWHIHWFGKLYFELRGKRARRFREDFCGTALMALQWVRLGSDHSAEGWDLDREVLNRAQRNRTTQMSPDEKKRIVLKRKNVLEASKPDFDFIAACNFSFFIFKERKILIDYFKAAKKSLRKDGILILEAAGGPGMIESIKERKVFKKDGKREFTYIWDQKSFDPVNNRGQYAIHFRLASGKVLDDAFEYDWRLWSIPELKDALLDAGFKSAEVYWESSHRDEGTGEYYRAQEGDNAYSWIAYIVGLS